MSRANHLRLAAVDGALTAPVASKRQRRAKALDRGESIRLAVNDAGGISRTCNELREIVHAFVTAARTGDLIVVRALARDMEIEARYAAQMSEKLARRLAELTAEVRHEPPPHVPPRRPRRLRSRRRASSRHRPRQPRAGAAASPDAALLAIAPKLLPLLERAEAMGPEVSRLYEEADEARSSKFATGDFSAGHAAFESVGERNGYIAKWEARGELLDRAEALIAPFLQLHHAP